jgi:hypothetical protein
MPVAAVVEQGQGVSRGDEKYCSDHCAQAGTAHESESEQKLSPGLVFTGTARFRHNSSDNPELCLLELTKLR